MQYMILTLDQFDALIAATEKKLEEAFQRGIAVGRGDVGEEMDRKEQDAYDDGYGDGNDKGYDEGYRDGCGDSYDEGYSDGYENGYNEAEVRAAEAAAYGHAFEEEPHIHAHCEGARFVD